MPRVAVKRPSTLKGLTRTVPAILPESIRGARVKEGKCEVVVLRFMLQSDLISNDGAGDLAILVLKSAGSRDVVVGHDEFDSPRRFRFR